MKIGIIGYGWLAKQITPVLSRAHEVYSFSRSEESKEHHYIVDWSQPDLWPKELNEVDFFLLMLPPRDEKSLKHIYGTLLQNYTHAKGILISSTGVYTAVNEERKQKLLSIEQLFEQHPFQVIRLGGLVGPNRNLALLMSGRPVESREKVRFIHSSEIAHFLSEYLTQLPTLTPPFAFYHPITASKGDWYAHFQERENLTPSIFKDEHPNLAIVPTPHLPMAYEWLWENVLDVPGQP